MEVEIPKLTKEQKKGSLGTILTWITILSFGAASLGPYIAPGKFATKKEEAVIHEDVEQLKEEIKEELTKDFEIQIAESTKEHKRLNNKIYNLEQENILLKNEVKVLHDLVEGLDKQVRFNSHSNSNTNEALIENMLRQKECDWVYYETQTKDNWYLYDDWYECKTLQRVTLLSGCRARINPFDRSVIQVR